jgi:hypothetical protein
VKQNRRNNQGKFKVYDGTSGWYRTERFGWYVHRPCNKPNFFVVRDFIKNMLISSGNDLLPELEARHALMGEEQGEHDQVAEQGEQPPEGAPDSEESRRLLPGVEAPTDQAHVPVLAEIDDGPRHWLTAD